MDRKSEASQGSGINFKVLDNCKSTKSELHHSKDPNKLSVTFFKKTKTSKGFTFCPNFVPQAGGDVQSKGKFGFANTLIEIRTFGKVLILQG